MTEQQFYEWITQRGACLVAKDWVYGKTLEQAWEQCSRADWMIWLLICAENFPRSRVQEVILDCIEARLNTVETDATRTRGDLLRKSIQKFRDGKESAADQKEILSTYRLEWENHIDLVHEALVSLYYDIPTSAMDWLTRDDKFPDAVKIIRAKVPWEHIELRMEE